MVFVEPLNRGISQELAYFIASKIWPRITPRGVGSFIVIEVNTTAVVFAPPVELPASEVGWTEVVKDDIDQDGNASLVAGIDELFDNIAILSISSF